jgi:hypothetical protein
MYFDDHLPPHFHAEYNEFEVLIEIKTLKIYAGFLPNKQFKKVKEWASNNQVFLLEKWNEFNPNK